MKHFTTALIILLFSQITLAQKDNASYKTLWKQVEKLDREDLTKSALAVATKISEKGKKEKNTAQVIKALLHSAKYAMTLEEDAQLKIITDFKSEIEKAESPTKNILESYLANLYWQYFQQNRYQFYNRTKTAEKVDPNDFRTWDLTTLFKEITVHFEASLENESELMKIPVSKFDLILIKQTGSAAYRPTLFDLLAHTALNFYKTNENNITRPANKFEIDNPELLCDGNTFTSQSISTQDDTSLQAKALCIYQKLLNLHSSSEKPYTFAEVNIERLHFIYQNATFKNKEQQLLDVFQNAATASKKGLKSSLYRYEIADLLNRQGNTYQPKTNKEHRFKRKLALAICESVIKELPKSKGAQKCKALKSQILGRQLQLTAERHIPTNRISRLLVNYKNHTSLHLTARHITNGELKKLEKLYPKEKILAFLKKLPIAKDWEATLKNADDYQLHSTEITIPPLENGQYIILAEPKDKAHKTFSYSPIQATNLALVETQSNTHKYFQAVNRNNGKPIAGAKLTFRYRVNYNGPRMSKSLVADKTGTVTLALTKQNWNNVNITVSKPDEIAYFKDYYVNERYDRNSPEIANSCFLFTDRSIYRPGQPLYFKGIAIKKKKGISSLLKNTKVSIQIRDVNEQVLIIQEFTTSDYGSFAGEYVLPSNGLTGQFTMKVFSNEVNINGHVSFSVEEYKRPKFETSFEAVTETYKVNDSVSVKGTARAYAGSNITDAKVAYRVKRVVYYPRWYYWYHPYSNTTPQEITHGETTTDASGHYAINFKAVPDNSVDRKNLPTFSYEVSADVTDINGETHSTTSVVTVGYHTMTANMSISNPFNKDTKDNKLNISTNNLNGQFVPAQGTVKMYKLKAPNNVLRSRTWPAPDYAGFSKEKFKELYPHDAFDTEHDAATWDKGELVWTANFDTEKSNKIILTNTKKWGSGKYVLELESQDKFGQPVKDILQTTLFSHNDKKLADNQLFQIKTDKEQYVAGDKVKVTLLSSAEILNVTIYVEKDHKVIDTHIIRLNNNSKTFTVPVTTDDLGGFSITYSYAAYNSFQAGSLNILVPYPSTDLEIETLTFRDKLQPGTDETWSFKIKGAKGNQVSAELLASMYDASLDAFQGHSWNFNPLVKPTYYSNRTANAYQCFTTTAFNTYQNYKTYNYNHQNFDSFNWFGLHFGYRRFLRGYARGMVKKESNTVLDDVVYDENEMALETDFKTQAGLALVPPPSLSKNKTDKQQLSPGKDENKNESLGSFVDVKIRKNLQETAFFFPQLHTDKNGNVSFNFTTPEALTKWNLQLLAHTKTLESSIKGLQTVTQKELMVIPNAPRFLREGDEITISSKIANLTEKPLSGQAKLELVDALTGENITQKLLKTHPSEELEGNLFKVDSMGNTQVSWRLKISAGLQAVQYKVIAKAGDFSDGEQNVLPVLTNRMLVTETLPMWVRSNQTKTFVLDKLKTTSSTTLKHHKLTLEMTSNPAWYAVQALPYLMEYPYECNEQTFSKYYANTLASHIANSNPRIQEVFQQWANSDALISNLEKNQELKSLLIQETPWLRDAQSETEQKKRIGLLFNLNKMKSEQSVALNKLKQNQKSSGAWAWFNGGRDNRFITQHILTGFGHLKQLNITSATLSNQESVIQKAITYLDHEFVKEYQNMKKYAKNLNDDHLSQTQIHYLYMRSFFKDVKSSKRVDEISSYYNKQAQKYWVNKALYSKGMLALVMHRMEDAKTANKILRALDENSITSEELGMYWKENTNSWYWYQAPIETQSLLIEAFSEIHPNDIETADNLKIWLLKNKQTNQWKTTKATTEAVYALLLQGSNWLSVTDAVDVLVGGEKIEPSSLENVKVEAGTGYYKTSWNGNEIKPQMAEIQISKKGEGIAWGALYWQYFEDLDKITSADTPLKLKKKLFLKKNTDTGEEISEITSKTSLKVGDLVRIRIELRADRPMEFVHMKDMRAAGFEPINVLSQYKWQDGLGYYESTKDASTNFFFDYLPKGVYIFEYDLRVNNVGDFSNGITTIQSMYAPEFSSHSEGVRVHVK